MQNQIFRASTHSNTGGPNPSASRPPAPCTGQGTSFRGFVPRLRSWLSDTTRWSRNGYGSVHQGSIFSHAKDLLYELVRNREHGRGVMFVAHSLGGIIVKDMLRRSEASKDSPTKDILYSTIGLSF